MKFEYIRNIVTIHKGRKHDISNEKGPSSIRVLQIDDLRNDNLIKYTNDKTGVLAKDDDLLIVWDGANAGTVGFGKTGYIGSTIAVLIKKEALKYSTIFLGKFLQSKFSHLRKNTTGATIPHIDRKCLESLKVPVLDIEDQRHIANILSKAEALIAQRKQSIALLDELLKSTFLEMFGDPVRKKNEWDQIQLGDLLNVKHGFAFQGEFFSDMGQFVLLTPGNFHEGGGYRDRREKQKYFAGEVPKDYLLKKGDLLIAMTEQAPGLLGSPIIVPKSNQFLHNQRLGHVIFDECNFKKHFLFHLFNTKSIRHLIHAKATGTKVRHTSPTKIEEIKISYPPIELQIQFTQIVEKTEALKTYCQQSLQELENLYGSLSLRAFKGELNIEEEALLMAAEPEVKYKKS